MAIDAAPNCTTFEEDLTGALGDLRGRLGEAIGSIGLAPGEPQEIARRLGISRNLTWKVSKVVCSEDVFEATQHMPGEEGIEILLNALGDAGVEAARIDAVRATTRRFDAVVETHSGDRATLDLMLDGMGGSAASRLEQSRKQAFRGNSGVWGIQARARMTSLIVAPTRGDTEHVDLALLGGMFDIRRLRPHVTWPIFYPMAYHDDGTPVASAVEEPLDDTVQDKAGPHLLREFCTETMPEIRARKAGERLVYEFGPGPVGNTGAFSMVFGSLTPGQVSRRQTPEDAFGESTTRITMPTGAVQFDLLLHRDLAFGEPEAAVIGRVAVPNGADDFHDIPIAEQPRELSGRPPMLGSALIPRYEAIVQRAMDRCGWSVGEFRVYRLQMQYPPMHSVVRMRFGLEPA
ncbi:MAG: hypothetical protein KDA05_08935 [Phycisphaerales bacterium]|nr:hypothetical protein [Phycisphaerales bacterium]MCB9840647.1 hypothetical protein [Phycisphaeraceae bacterium]